jgi:hypothetical protein
LPFFFVLVCSYLIALLTSNVSSGGITLNKSASLRQSKFLWMECISVTCAASMRVTIGLGIAHARISEAFATRIAAQNRLRSRQSAMEWEKKES